VVEKSQQLSQRLLKKLMEQLRVNQVGKIPEITNITMPYSTIIYPQFEPEKRRLSRLIIPKTMMRRSARKVCWWNNPAAVELPF